MRIGFIPVGDRNIGSARMSVYHVIQYISKFCEVEIINNPRGYNRRFDPNFKHLEQMLNLDILVIQKVDQGAIVDTIPYLQAHGVKVIYLVGDLFENKMVQLADKVIVSSRYLKQKLGNLDKIDVIEDGYEAPEQVKHHTDKKILDVYYVGTQNIDNRFTEQIKALPDITFTKIGLNPWCDILWKLETVYEELEKADIVVVPVELTEFNKCKSLNRILNPMIMGLPVIASEVPSYKQVIKHGENGYFTDGTDIAKYINIFRNSNIRNKIGKNAYSSIIGKHSMQKQCRRYMEEFQYIK